MGNKLTIWIRRIVAGDPDQRDEAREVRREALSAVEQKRLELGRALQELAEARQKNGSPP